MSTNKNFKYPNIITYVKNVLDPYIIAIRGSFKDIRIKLDELKNIEDTVNVAISDMEDSFTGKFNDLRDELYDKVDNHLSGANPTNLADAKALKLNELVREQEEETAKGFTWNGNTFKGDIHSVQFMMATSIQAINAIADGTTFARTLTLVDGSTVIVHDHQFAFLIVAFTSRKEYINNHMYALIDRVNSATTVAAVLNINWNTSTGITIPNP